MPKKKKSWKERQRERQIRQQRAQESYQIMRDRKAERKPRQRLKGKILAVCLLVLVFGIYGAWQYTPSTIWEEATPEIPTFETIYIKSSGSVEPSTAPIMKIGNIYTFTADINGSIVIERDNIVISGTNYVLQGYKKPDSKGIDLTERSNVTITSVKIRDFDYGIYLHSASHNVLSQNDLTNNNCGIWLHYASNNTILANVFRHNGLIVWEESYENAVKDNWVNDKPLVYLEDASGYTVKDAGQVVLVNCDDIVVENLNLSYTDTAMQLWHTTNTRIANNNIANNTYGIVMKFSSGNTLIGNTITANNLTGIYLQSSSGNSISGNNLTHNGDGIWLDESAGNNLDGNDITNNEYGIVLIYSSNNRFCHNNFIDNIHHVYDLAWGYPEYYTPSINTWDNEYPSGGNYWSDYRTRYPDAGERDDSGIWNTAYAIDENNHDNYPLMNR